MAKRKYNRKAKRVPRKRTVVRKALRQVANARIKAVVRKVLGKQVEVKNIQTINTLKPRNTLATVSDLALYNVFQLSPNADYAAITIGNGPANRLGNQITTKYCKMRIVLYPAPYSVTNNPSPKPTIVKFWCLTPKDGYLSSSEVATIFDTSFFQSGNSSSGYGLDMTDLVKASNKDVYTLHWTRTYKLGHAVGSGNGYGAGNGINDSNFSNNDYKMNYILNFDFTKHMKKTFRYNDTQVTPQGKAMFLVVGIYNADGTAMSSSAVAPVDMYLQHDYGFTDM